MTDISESQIKRLICDWLNTQPECFFWVQSAGRIPGRRGKSPYQRNGIPDILGVWRKRPLAIEVKRPDGRVSQAQSEFLQEFTTKGGIGFVAQSLDDVIHHLYG